MAKPSRAKRKAILGKKLGMTQVFAEEGRWVPVTVLQAGPCTVLQVKTIEKDGYSAFQLGFDDTRKKRKRPQQAYLDKLGLGGKRFVKEVPYLDPADLEVRGAAPGTASAAPQAGEGGEGAAEDAAEAAAGTADKGAGEAAAAAAKLLGGVLDVRCFKGVGHVDVRGVTKGRGFAGVIRRYHFNAGPKSHGSKNIREPGSTGMHTDPGRVLKGKRMPGHLGAVKRKMRNLKVVGIEEADNLLLVRGSVPGANGCYVYIEQSLAE